MVMSHKGAQYNVNCQVSAVVADNEQVYSSNYPKAQIILRHQFEKRFFADTFVVKSESNSRNGAFPVGQGIVFTSDVLCAFENTTPFHDFSHEDYCKWRERRKEDPRPLQAHEPAGYFQMDDKNVVVCEFDSKRPCRYILVKPTGFREQPTNFVKHKPFKDYPVEIKYFGVTGTVLEYEEAF